MMMMSHDDSRFGCPVGILFTDEALKIAQLAMQRGIYMTAVTSLEKVTRFCSTNSPVGSKVFLELAMAYEASGRTQEAYQVYKTLSTCRMEEVKYQARRLLYGLEAMEFMSKLFGGRYGFAVRRFQQNVN